MSDTSMCIFGAPLDTGNLGVSALGQSVVQGIQRLSPQAAITVFDHGKGVRQIRICSSSDSQSIELCGAKLSRRLYQPETLGRIRLAARLGGLFNPAAKHILRADAILDISGGDSFTDLYGQWRFRQVCLPKFIALENKKPLVLLPQTYGPFKTSKTQATASKIVRKCTLAYARDQRSFAILRELLGDAFDPARHRCGVDVAFALEPADPGDKLPAQLRDMLESNIPNTRPVGLNVSGLIYHDRKVAQERYGFKADYRNLIHQLASGLLDRTDSPVLLVPHVLTPVGHYESDPFACKLARQSLPAALQGRVHIVPPHFDASEMKWIIARCQWFCGTRMHSTIASLSSGVPTAAIAYSDKTRGVFETCGQGSSVIDPRELETMPAADQLLDCFDHRHAIQASLNGALPSVLLQAEQQMHDVVAFIASDSTTPSASPQSVSA